MEEAIVAQPETLPLLSATVTTASMMQVFVGGVCSRVGGNDGRTA
jgi:hypothetical protein